MSSIAVLTAGTVMDSSASLMNDTAKQVYTYVVQIPYLNRALQELQEFFELNEIPVVGKKSAVIPVDAGISELVYDNFGDTKLPDDMVEPQIVWERARDTDPYVPMNRVEFLNEAYAGNEINQFISYVWESQKISFFPAIQDNDIKIDYISSLFVPITDSADPINVINAESYLAYRTAGLCSEFIGENKTRADALNADASLALDRVVGIGAKGRQLIMTRRRPFRSSYKRFTFI